MIETIKYEKGKLTILDQTELPRREIYLTLSKAEDTADAIYRLKVRGAPAVGVAAAYGICGAVACFNGDGVAELEREFYRTSEIIKKARPTAVNISWAVERMRKRFVRGLSLAGNKIDFGEIKELVQKELEAEAGAIHREDVSSCTDMGENGLELLSPGMGILTHCNAGALATTGIGTCLGPIYLGQERGYNFKVYADETRPLLQGGRLTCWELKRSGVDVTLICDNMAATVMKKGEIDAVVVGCDRLAANGDGANKIGTLALAILAKQYNIPFYMFVPTPSVDMSISSGNHIPIEERIGEEIYRKWYMEDMAPKGISVLNPAFDVTDAEYITAIITEKGVCKPPYENSLEKLMENKERA